MTLVILTEEPSMVEALRELLPKIGIDEAEVIFIKHDGVTELEASLSRKLRNWRDPNARFLVLRDADQGDCRARKSRLMEIVQGTGRADRTVVRIVCQELEAWFLGDQAALAAAGYPSSKRLRKVRDPDAVAHPSRLLQELVPMRTKIAGARDIARHMNVEVNQSVSFQRTITALRRLTDRTAP